MSLIFGHIDFKGKNEQNASEILKNDLSRYPTDESDRSEGVCYSFGLNSIRLRKPPYPKDKILEDKEAQIVLIADARLDYREELLQKLERGKEELLKHSDPELILMAFKKWEKKCVNFLEGDFCFLILNLRTNKVWGARDPIGFRPLFFTQKDNTLYFSSSIKGLLNLELYGYEPNDNFWGNRILGLSCNPNATPHKNIFQLPIGHEIQFEEGSFTCKSYYEWKRSPIALSKKERELGLRKLIEDAVKTRFYPDYEVGTQLSGGLDSSSVTALVSMEMSKIDKSRKIWTVSSVAAEGQEHERDERPWIRLFTENFENISNFFVGFEGNAKYNKEHKDIFAFIRFRRYDSFEIEERFNDHLTTKNCKTVLTGWRGDHFVSRHAYYSLNDLLVSGKWIELFKNFQKIKAWRGTTSTKLLKKLIKSNAPLPLTVKKAFPLLNQDWLNENKKAINELEKKENKWKLRNNKWDFERFLPTAKHQLNFYMEDISFLLSKPICVLHPLSDARVIKYALNFKGSDLEQDGRDRAIFRNAMRGILPERIRLRNKKGFYNFNEIKQLQYVLPMFLKENESLLRQSPFNKYIDVDQVLKEVKIFCENSAPIMELKIVLSLNLIGYLLYFATQEDSTL